MDSKYLSYSSSTKYNREVFLLNYGKEMAIFEENNSLLHALGTLISEKKDDEGNFHIGLLPLVLIIERQTTIAFDCLSRYQSYATWMAFRPALESLLIIGKFIDDPENARIWKYKEDNFKEYLKKFQGKALVSKSLPHAKKYRKLLSTINDEFMHSNYSYFEKNLIVKPFDSKKFYLNIQYFDDDFLEHKAFLFSFLHIYRLIIVSLGKALALKFKGENIVNVEFESMEKELKHNVIELVKERPDLLEKCRKFGLWDV